MAARTIFVPVGYAEAADRIADLVERGVIRIQHHWRSREACQSYIDSLPSFLCGRYWPTAAVVRVAEGDQRSRTGLHADERLTYRPITISGDTAVIELTKGLHATIDAADVTLVEGRSWYTAYPTSGRPYAASRGRKSLGEPSTLYLHILLMGRRSGLEIDHADGDGLNNRRSNLRWATRAQNQFNIGPKAYNPSGLKGISFDPRCRKWRARIRIGGRETFLGYFETPEAAAEAYREAAHRYHGEFMRVA